MALLALHESSQSETSWKPASAIAQHFGLPERTARIFRMGLVGGNSAGRLQENSGGMLVRWYRIAKGQVAKVLESIGQCVVLGVPGLPKAVALGKFFPARGW